MAINRLVAALCTVFVLSGQYRLATAQEYVDSEAKIEQAIDACITNATNVEDGCNATDYAGSSNCSIAGYSTLNPDECYVGFVCFTDGDISVGLADLLGSCAAACRNLHAPGPPAEYAYRNCSEPASTLAPETGTTPTEPGAGLTTVPIVPGAVDLKIKLGNGDPIPAATMETWDASDVISSLAAAFQLAPYHIPGWRFYNVTIDATLEKVTIETERAVDAANITNTILDNVIPFTIGVDTFRANLWDPLSTTPAPIPSPTAAPTAAPMTPTAAPTSTPTAAPTPSPMPAPTKSPTIAPTSPTVAPTPSPSSAPTPQPTLSPATGPAGPVFRLELGGGARSVCAYGDTSSTLLKANIRQAVLDGTTLITSQLSEDGVTFPNCTRRARRSTGNRFTAMVQLTTAVTTDMAEAALDDLTTSGMTGSAVFLDYTGASLTLMMLGMSSGGATAEMHASATRGPSSAPTAAVLVNTLTFSPTADSSLDLSQATSADDSNDAGMIALGVILALVFVGLLVATVWVLRNYKLPGRLAKAEPLSEAKEELLAGDTSANDADPYRMATMSDPLQSSTDPYRMATGSDPLQANTRPIQQTSIDSAAADLMAMEAHATSGDTYASQVQLRKVSGAATMADRMSNFGALELQPAAPGAPPDDGGYIESSPLPVMSRQETKGEPTSMTLGGVTAGESKMDGMSLGSSAGQDVTVDALQLSNSASGETNLDSMRIDQIKARLSPEREAAASGIPMGTGERFVEQEGALNRTGDNRTSQC